MNKLFLVNIFLVIFCIFILFFIISIVLCAVIGYIGYVYFKKKLFNYEIKDFNKKTKKVLQQYGNCKINRVFLIQKPIDYIFIFGMYWIYNTDISNFYHMGVLVEIEYNKKTKMFFIEKNEGIYIYDNFPILNNYEIHISKKIMENISLNSMLDKTKKEMGNSNFFNWHILNNNCSHFSIELLKSLGINKTKKFKQLYQTTEFTLNEKMFLHYSFMFIVQCFSFANYL